MKQQLCTIALSGFLAMGMSLSASAQDATQPQAGDAQQGSMQGPGMHHGMDPDQQLAHMTKRYNLTADQQSQLKPILVEHQQQMMALHSNTSLSREDKMAKMQSLQQDHSQKVEAVLTADQKTKFEADQAKMKEHMQHMHDGGMGAPDSGAAAPPPAQ